MSPSLSFKSDTLNNDSGIALPPKRRVRNNIYDRSVIGRGHFYSNLGTLKCETDSIGWDRNFYVQCSLLSIEVVVRTDKCVYGKFVDCGKANSLT